MSSDTPKGDFTPDFASNYMMDGFDFDSGYGEGPLNKRNAPTTSRTTGQSYTLSQKGMSALPDGFVTGDRQSSDDADLFAGADGTDVGELSGMVREANQLTDFSWLELAEQDPDRLPKVPNDAVLLGLVEAWGTNRRTDGVEVIPNVVVPPPPRSQVALLPGDHFREVVASAMRKAMFGTPFPVILGDVVAHIGPNMGQMQTDPKFQRFASAIRSIRAEHGILGRLYLRDSAFPGLLSGKWDGEIKKRCASAHYWLTRPGSKLAAYQNYLGKKVVTAIPWKEALDHYRPILEGTGRKLASGDPKTVLLAALRQQEARSRKEASYTYHTMPVDRVTLEEAWKVFASSPKPSREVFQKKEATMTLEQVQVRVARWVTAGALPEASARKILAGDGTPEGKLRKAAEAAAHHTNKSRYAGQGVGVKVPNRPEKTAADAQREQAQVEATLAERAKAAADQKAREQARAASLLKANARKAKYAGEGVGASVHAGGIPTMDAPKDPRPLLRYAMRQMNEGAAGQDLDVLLASRFAQEHIKTAGEQLVQIRRKHEGLAGHVYVAAEVYASPTGTTGCDQGALIHRANQVPSVLAMSRCGSCTSNVEGACQKYGKKLVSMDNLPVKDVRGFQKETIRLANADDAERTAAMFNAYDPGEFDLQNDVLETFDYDNLPAHQELADVLFQGLVIPDEE